ncbi:MAG: hypothetical protein H6839_04385 [Planctomycetes bacterium]|nr:hypothetical protein [Planctomycetota bacterium]
MRYVLAIIPILLVAGCAGSRVPAARAQTEREPASVPQKEEFFREVDRAWAADQLKAADKLFAQGQYDEARKKYEEATESASGARDNSVLTEAYAQVARMYSSQTKHEEGKPWLAKAGAIATPDEPLGWSRYLGVRGRFEWQDEKDNDKAKATFIEMYDYCRKHKLFSRELDAAHMVAIVGSPDEQVEWALKAIEAAEKGGETGWLAPLWNNLGWTYESRGEYDKMLDALLKAREYHYKGALELPKLIADFGVGRAYWRNERYKEARIWLTDAFDRAKAAAEANPDDAEQAEWVGWGHVYIGDLLVSEGKPAEGLKELKAGRPILVKSGIEEWWPEALQELDDKIAKLAADADE